MKLEIETIQPDGLALTFKKSFVFDTWKEVFNFIERVRVAYIEAQKE